MYDVVGSVAGIEQLESREVQLVHEMGATIFSERVSTAIRRVTTGAIAQDIQFNVFLTDLPATPYQILGVTVFASVAARVTRASVAVRQRNTIREFPIWMWDTADDAEVSLRLVDNGAAVGTVIALRPVQLLEALPHFTTGSGQPQSVPDIAFRGTAASFGAGTVIVTALLHVGFSEIGGISSRGLPIPSW